MKTGLFFGSFNPIHTGHLVIAQTMLESTDMENIWFIVSPQNPFKKRGNLAHEEDRYNMVQAATYDNYKFRVSDIEFTMPRPSYTVDTLAYLGEKHPDHEFSLIIGEDNLKSFHKWKNADFILDNYRLYVYPRPGGSEEKWKIHPSVSFVDAPLIDISATKIRKLVKEGKSITYLVPQAVEAYIRDKGVYG